MPGMTDWNDLHQQRGLDEVRRQIESQLQAANDAALAQPGQGEGDPDLPPAEAYIPTDAARADWESGLQRSQSSGAIKPMVSNIRLIMENREEFDRALGYCDFSYRVIKHRAPIPHLLAGEWEDSDTAYLRDWMGHQYHFEPNRSNTVDALVVVAKKQRFHPVREYLKTLKWDGVPRLDYWLSDALGATGDGEYLAAAGRKFLIGAVARVMRPGCKMDTVLILEGKQGKGKSTIVSVLFGDWFSDAPLPLGDKDAYQNIQGVWGIELAELDSLNKAESTTAKMFFSQRRDRYRPSYGQTAQDFPRQCVFIGTTNQEEYLKDYTGNRRYWPVRCMDINVEWVIQQRDQLWAEAFARFQNGETWHVNETEKPLFDAVQEERLQLDPWHYAIENWLRELPDARDFVTAEQILKEAIKKDYAHQQRADQNRVAPIMKELGWHKTREAPPGHTKRKHGYKRPECWEHAPASLVDNQGDDIGLPYDE